MPYVMRDSTGEITAVCAEPFDKTCEEIAADAPELRAFVERMAGDRGAFEASDLKLIRAIEDVIDVLIEKNLICITDLPQAVQSKLMERRSLRHSLNALKLFGDDDQGIL